VVLIINISGAHVGFIRNTVLKTIIKEALLDVTESISRFQSLSGMNSFGAALEKWATEEGFSDKFFNKQSWEGQFLMIILSVTSNEVLTKTGNAFGGAKDSEILFKLVRNWVIGLKGSPSRLEMTIKELNL
jgi:hypothetical protein